MKKHALQLSSIETAMFEEIFNVISRYANQTREFGISLVHSHFPLKENEVLYETHDKSKRVMQVTPVRKNQVSDKTLATAWCKKNGNIQVAMFCCDEVMEVENEG